MNSGSCMKGIRPWGRIADVYESYDLGKSKKHLMDFDDLLLESYRLLSSHDEIRSKYAGRYLHLLVDEYQDTNPVQLEILKTLIPSVNRQADHSFQLLGLW